MSHNLFQHYVLGGGWVMLFLVPASVVALATIFRVAMRLWGNPVHQLAKQVRAIVIAESQKNPQPLSVTDARVIAMDFAMTNYLSLQPLSAIYALAPMLGALGSTWSMSRVWSGPVSLQGKDLQAALEQAFVPLGWGLVIGLISIGGYAILRARLARIEREVFAPAAIAALHEGRGPTRGIASPGASSSRQNLPRER